MRAPSISPFALIVLAVGCGAMQPDQPSEVVAGAAAVEARPSVPPVAEAVAVLSPTEGNAASGTVVFTPDGEHVRVEADLEGVAPGPHGFHVHELGDCRAADGSSAGGHFAPSGEPHGGPTDAHRHAGDLGNVVADESGHAHLDTVDPRLALSGPASILGRSVIVHAGADDLTSQPSGDAGPRAACGVIGITAE